MGEMTNTAHEELQAAVARYVSSVHPGAVPNAWLVLVNYESVESIEEDYSGMIFDNEGNAYTLLGMAERWKTVKETQFLIELGGDDDD